MRRRAALLHAALLALYAALAVLLTWPLVRHLSTHVPGSYTWAFDEYTFLWNSWWFRYALTELHQSPLHTGHIFYPLGISLILYTFNLFNAVVALPLQSFLTLPAISNLTFLAATALSGYGTFLLVRYLLLPGGVQADEADARPATAAAFLAGLVYAFGSYRMVYAAIGHYDLWSTQWIPFYTLYLVKTIREPRLRHALLAALLLVLVMLAEMSFGVFLAALTLILLAFALGQRGRRSETAAGCLAPAPGLGLRLALLVLVAGLLYAPLLVPILREMRAGYELAGWGDAQKLSVDLFGLVTPAALHPLGGDWSTTLRQVQEGTSRFSDVNTVFLGWSALALALLGAVACRRRLAAWITAALTFAVLSLGPLLQINGRSLFNLDGLETTVPLPFLLLHYLPVVKANRVPNRFSVVLMLALAVLAAFGAYLLFRKLAGCRPTAHRRSLPALAFLLLAALLLFDGWSVPLPLTDARVPEVYDRLAADPADYAILQLPLGWRNSFGVQGAESTQTQYYQSVHHKRLLSGNISRNPAYKFDYFSRVPVLESLIALETYGAVDPERRASDRASAGEMLAFYDVRYVVVAPGIPGRPPYIDTRDAAVAYVEEVLPVEKVYDGDGWLLYEVQQPPLAESLTVDLGSGTPVGTMALGEGWSTPETIQGYSAHWAQAQGARLLLPAVAGVGYSLSLSALPLDYPGAEPQEVTLSVNGQELTSVEMQPGWLTYTWEIDAALVHSGVNDLRFRFGRLEAPADVIPGDGQIGATGVVAPVAVEVHSGGPDGFAFITIGDTRAGSTVDGSLHEPGYNLAVLDAATGRLLERAAFDLTETGSEREAAAMVAWMGSIPPGSIVAGALQGCQTPYLVTGVAEALLSVGATGTVGPKADCSHAFIGVKDPARRSGLEAYASGGSWLRVAPDRRTLAMALDRVTWERLGR
ncbi:MAG TPA: interleukin-like EMT inducer domain-containing protein [Anaerolineae bacterium]|nr:interleukin-like EMT inducer domain-containing protein [Anaerolineae bacterium]